jgi:hypothetical protein
MIEGNSDLTDTSLTDADIQAIEQRLERATPGPWIEHLEKRDEISGSDVIATADQDIYLPGASEADYIFVANARQDIPRLLAEIRRLRREISQA